MTTVAPPTSHRARALAHDLEGLARRAGLDAIGIARATRFESARFHLYERKAAGLHGGMAFTYRNPDRSTDPGRIVRSAASLVVGARSYRHPHPGPPGGTAPARVARYAWSDEYAPLRRGLEVVAERLRAEGYCARVVVDDNALVDREAAVQAGLGWYGKNANVLLPGRGSWFVLGSVVTDAQLPPSRPLADGCGPCVRCLHSCPTGAIVAPGVIDARRCLAWLLEAPGPFPRAYRELLGDRIYGCDDCQDSCPHNIRAPATDTTDRPPGARPWVDAVRLLSLDDAELMAAAGSWYVAERNPRYLRRNALVVLGNVGDGRSAEVVEALAAALHHDDPLVRGHAVWAAARVGRPELADGLDATERDTAVLNELAGRVAVTPNAGAALTSDGVVSDEAPGRTRR